jgi:hypothetical protein
VLPEGRNPIPNISKSVSQADNQLPSNIKGYNYDIH